MISYTCLIESCMLFSKTKNALLKSVAPGLVVLVAITGCTSEDIAQESRYLDPAHSPAEYIACLAEQNVTLISAHRGGKHTGFPENALESMQEAVSYGPILLEMDVRETADGHLVLLHDDTLDRTTNGTGDLTDYSLADLEEVRLTDASGTVTSFSIPTLAEVLTWAKNRAIVQLDVKPGVDYARVAQAVVDADAIDSALLIAYQVEDAVTALSVDSSLTFSIQITSEEELAALDAAGVPRTQIVAWTGVLDQPTQAFWSTLEDLGIASSAGAQGAIEAQMAEGGDLQPYVDIAEGGVDVIAAGQYRQAFDALAAQQDMAAGLAACAGK